MENNLHTVELDIRYPDPITFVMANANTPDEKKLTIPGILKMTLTEESEKKIFGSVSPYRTAHFPPLWGNEQYLESKLAIIDESETIRYNAVISRIYKEEPDQLEKKKIKPGKVKVFRASHNLRLTNVE